jgi:hypothetical protein
MIQKQLRIETKTELVHYNQPTMRAQLNTANTEHNGTERNCELILIPLTEHLNLTQTVN